MRLKVPNKEQNSSLEIVSNIATISRRIERHMAISLGGIEMFDDEKASFQEWLSAFADVQRKKAKLLPPVLKENWHYEKFGRLRQLPIWISGPGERLQNLRNSQSGLI